MMRSRVVFASLAVGLVLASTPGSSQTSPLVPTDWLDALWVADADALWKYDTNDDVVVFSNAERGGVRAIAPDEDIGLTWILGPARPVAYLDNPLAEFNGGTIVERHWFNGDVEDGFFIDNLNDRDLYLDQSDLDILWDANANVDGTPLAQVDLAVDSGRGYGWIVLGSTYYLYDNALTRIRAATLRTPLSLDYDPWRDRAWILDRDSLRIHSPTTGLVAATFALGQVSQDVIATPEGAWVARENDLVLVDWQFGVGFSTITTAPVADAFALAWDGEDVWAATSTAVHRVNTSGAVELTIPNGELLPLITLAADRSNQTPWFGTRLLLKHTTATGTTDTSLGVTLLRAISHYADLVAPSLTFTSPVNGALVGPTPSIGVAFTDNSGGIDAATFSVTDPSGPTINCTVGATSATCTPATGFSNGSHTLTARARDLAGHVEGSVSITIDVDAINPVVTLTAPANGSFTNQADWDVVGSVSESLFSLTLNGVSIAVDPDTLAFSTPVTFVEGSNPLNFVAMDWAGNLGTLNAGITLDTIPPPQPCAFSVVSNGDGTFTASGPAGCAEPGTILTVQNPPANATVTVTVAPDGSFTVVIVGIPGDTLFFTFRDAAQNTTSVDRKAPGVHTPPNPTLVAPSLDPTVATNFSTAVSFLYRGNTRVQAGAYGIDDLRVAVARGRVLDATSQGLGGVLVDVVSHPELGETRTRSNGEFDLAVNGGGALTIRFRKTGFIESQRLLEASIRNYDGLHDVVLIAADSASTLVDFAAPSSTQIAESSSVTDDDGTRSIALLLPPGISAEAELANGSIVPVTSGTVRATEFTVGAAGPKRMPAALPPTSAYTLAFELSLDEYPTAREIRFDRPIPTYVENFLGLPVGEDIPVGYYDRSRGVWGAEQNARAIEIASITNGRADLIIDGTGLPASESQLAALGITTSERDALATLYSVGQELWRVPVTHFSPWDLNLPPAFPDGAEGPPAPDAEAPPISCPMTVTGSVIDCDNRVLQESIPITGTPFSLVYSSDRAPGFGQNRTLRIPISEGALHPDVIGMRVSIDVAGKRFDQSFAPATNVTSVFTWDGLDAYGRPVQGRVKAHFTVCHEYQRVYLPSLGPFGFGIPGGSTIGLIDRENSTAELCKRNKALIGFLDSRGPSIGGWSLSAHHVYHPDARTIYPGHGGERSGHFENLRIETIAGGGEFGAIGTEDIPALGSTMFPDALAAAPDGTIYFIDWGLPRVRKITPEGMLKNVAGTGVAGFSGDGGDARLAKVREPSSLAVGPDGSLYITDRADHRIRRVDRNGIISTIAGTGVAGFNGDARKATTATLHTPIEVETGPDGTVYFIDRGTERVRRIDGNGIIQTVAGGNTAQWEHWTDLPVRATSVRLPHPSSLSIGPQGDLFVAVDETDGLAGVDLNGMLDIVIGGGTGRCDVATCSESTIALAPQHVVAMPDGTVLIYEGGGAESNIYRARPNGDLWKIAKTPFMFNEGLANLDNGAALSRAWIGYDLIGNPHHGRAMAVERDGSILLAQSRTAMVMDPLLGYPRPWFWGIRRARPTLPTHSPDEASFFVPSAGGDEVQVFAQDGRHLQTRTGLLSVPELSFAYSAGRLTTITDQYGNVTAIERNGSNVATAIVAPGGQRTPLTFDANGWLKTVTNPATETTTLTTDANGLLRIFKRPKGGETLFTYDGSGRLTREDDAAGGFKTLTEQTGTLELETALGRTTTREVSGLSSRYSLRTTTRPDGTEWTSEFWNESIVTTAPDGTVSRVERDGDPRFGMDAPLVTSSEIQTPGGLVKSTTRDRSVTLVNPADPSTPATLLDVVTVNGKRYESLFERATRTITLESPEERRQTITLDVKGRVASVSVPTLALASFGRDSFGRVTTISATSGSETRTYTLGYDTKHRITSITDPLNRVVSFEHDLADRVTKQTLPDTGFVETTWDDNGNLETLKPPDKTAHAFGYTPIDLESSYTPPTVPGGGATSYAYNLDKQPTTETRQGTTAITRTYDATKGRVTSLAHTADTVTFNYHATNGKVTSLSTVNGGTIAFSYDGPLITEESFSGPFSGSVQRTFNADLRLATEKVNGAHEVGYSYDDDGLVTAAGELTLTRDPDTGFVQVSTLGGVTENREYNGFGELTRLHTTAFGTNVLDQVFVRDTLGRITQKTETVDGITKVYTYDYDPNGRLEEVKIDGVTSAFYTYDKNGNRTSRNSEIGAYDAQDRLTSYAGATYTYTPNGELATKTDASGTTSYMYDAFSNLRQVTLPNGDIIDYVADAKNRRVGKKLNGAWVQKFVYRDQLQPVAELDGVGNVISRFVYATKVNVPDYIEKPATGAVWRVVTDHLGSVQAVVDDATGVVVQRMEFDEFGRVLTDTNPGAQPFGFAGGLREQHAAFVRFGARDYDPFSGRWTTKDPVGFFGGDANVFGYSQNDPINRTDPTGYATPVFWVVMVFVVVPVAIGAVYFHNYQYYVDDSQREAELQIPLSDAQSWDQRDAFRHCYAACTMKLGEGDFITAAAGDGREYIAELFRPIVGDSNSADEHAMDLANNACGRAIVDLSSFGVRGEGDCSTTCKDLLFSGVLQGAP